LSPGPSRRVPRPGEPHRRDGRRRTGTLLRSLLLALALAPVPTGSARGQAGLEGADDRTEASAPGPRALCFRGRPAPGCRAFAVTEFVLGARGLGSGQRTDFHLQLDLGGMLNLTDRSALGGTFTLGPHHGERGGSLRYRYWAGPDLAIDLAPGAILAGDGREGRRFRLTGQVAVNINDRIGQFVQGESERDGGQLVAGLKLGSAAGLVVGGVLFLFLAALQ
jgi:hypothetical protein